MTEHRMPPTRARELLLALDEHAVDTCVGGGWAVDALVGRQTRDHSDLDLWAPAAQLEPLFLALGSLGVDRVFPWPGDRPWNFVLHDGAATRVDLHLYEPIDDDVNHYGSALGDERFPAMALSSHGRIDDLDVRCESAEWSLRWHTGYPTRPHDHHDVTLLCDEFGLSRPPGFRSTCFSPAGER